MEPKSPDSGAPTEASIVYASERVPTEQDITTLGFPDSPTYTVSTWAQSTDDLIPPLVDCDFADNPTRVMAETIMIPPSSLKPAEVSVEVKLADHAKIFSSSAVPTRKGRIKERVTEIELEELALPPAGARWHSTQHLIYTPALLEAKFCDERDIETGSDAVQETDYRPKPLDYKPPSLRWPFQAFLLLLTAGVFAFFEYEMHHLPPVDFRLFPSEQAMPGPQPRPRPRGIIAQATVTGTWSTSKVKRERVKIAVAAPDPTPDPRPPQSLFPGPIQPVTTHCGWSAPEWGINLWPGWGQPDGSYVINGDSSQYEYWIRTFYTDDETWCPCFDESIDPRGWGEGVRWLPSDGANSHDTECHSIIRAVIHHNWYFRMDMMNEGPALDEVRLTLRSVAALDTTITTTHFVPLSLTPTQPSWMYPSTDAAGSVLLPLYTRTYTSGHSFEAWHSWDYFDNPISTEGSPIWVATAAVILNNDASTSPPAGLTWWTLPLSRPTSHAAVPTITTVDSSKSTSLSSSQMSSSAPKTTVVVSSMDHDASGLSSSNSPTPTRDDSSEGHTSTSWSSRPQPSSTVIIPAPLSSPRKITTSSENLATSRTTKDVAAQSSENSGQAPSSGIKSSGATTGHGSKATSRVDNSSQESDQPTIVVPPALGLFATSSSSFLEATPTTAVTDSSHQTDDDPLRLLPSPRPAPSSHVSIDEGLVSVHTDTSKLMGLAVAKSDTHVDSTTFTETGAQPVEVVTRTTLTSSNGSFSVITMIITTTYHTRTADIESYSAGAITDGIIAHASRLLPSPAPVSRLNTSTITGNPGPTFNSTFPPKLGPGPGNGPIAPGAEARMFNIDSSADFLLASLIPVLATTLLSMAIQVFVSSLNIMLPFRALTARRKEGAKAKDSLLLARSSPSSSSPIYGPNISWRFLRQLNDPLALLNFLQSTISTILVPLSNEVIHLELTTECDNSPFSHDKPSDPSRRICAYGLRRQDTTMRVAETLLVALAILIVSIGYLLLRWRSGVSSEPWSVASMSSLFSGSSKEFKEVLRSTQKRTDTSTNDNSKTKHNVNADIRKAVLQKTSSLRFRLGYHDANSTYGIDIVDTDTSDDKISIKLTTRDPKERTPVDSKSSEKRRLCQWLPHVDTDTGRMIFNMVALVLTAGLLAVILYYENTVVLPSESTGFESFMSGQSFEVRVLFTALGTGITLFWDDYFSFISSTIIHTHMQPYSNVHVLSSSSHLLQVSPPAHIFDLKSIYHTMFRTRDISSLSIALATFLAKFTPILLSNIPFRNTITWEMHEVCTWMAVGVLSYMVVVLGIAVVAFFLRRSRARGRYTNTGIPMDNIAGLMSFV
ncbi:hypothetical protein V8F33_007942 [Rhypophila sp. PSN 637]